MDDALRIVLAQLLTLVALIGATIEYAEIVRRRAVAKHERAAAVDAGLHGLVRVMLADGS